eukprot:Nk52_evm1s13 gene=Nk52_evmTU1s13
MAGFGLNPLGDLDDAMGFNDNPQQPQRQMTRKEKQELLDQAEYDRVKSAEKLQSKKQQRRAEHEKRTADIRAKYNIPKKEDKKKKRQKEPEEDNEGERDDKQSGKKKKSCVIL